MSILDRTQLHERLACALRALTPAYLPFCEDMLAKLERQAQLGRRGWSEDEYFEQRWRPQLNRHIAKIGTLDRHEDERENLVDIANICMFAHWWLGQKKAKLAITIEELRPALRGGEGRDGMRDL